MKDPFVKDSVIDSPARESLRNVEGCYNKNIFKTSSFANSRRALQSGADKISRTFRSVRNTFGNLSQHFRLGGRRRHRLTEPVSPCRAPTTPVMKKKQILGRSPTKLYSPFGIETPHSRDFRMSPYMPDTPDHGCATLTLNGTRYCEWGYNGLGIDYQVLAGPAFMAVFTVVGVILGVVADKFNRARILSFCTLVFVIAILIMGSVKEYWHLVVLRMIMAAGESGCNPLATGILTDLFPEKQRALALSIFNWGIYGGYGIAFPVGRYIPDVNAWGLSWRVCYYGAGIVGLVITLLTFLTLREPSRTTIGEEGTGNKAGDSTLESGKKMPQVTIWHVIAQPRIILLCLAASIRHCGGMCFAYNADLYYRDYFPDVDLGWWLFAVTVGIGSVGVVAGGIISDKYVEKMGVRSRVLVLALSQLIATLPAFGSVVFGPLWAMITLAISYFFAEMWFGIVFAILVEIVPLSVRSTTVGVFLFVMNNVGGNLPILVDPVSKIIGYREAIMIFYAGFYGISSIMFFLTMFLMDGPIDKPATTTEEPKRTGLDNRAFTQDELPTRNAGRSLPIAPSERL